MGQFRLSTWAWKWLISALALFSAILLVIEFTHAIKPLLIDGQQGSIGMVLVDPIGATEKGQGTSYLRIDSVASDSQLGVAGAVAGNRIRFDRYEDRWRRFAPGEAVGLTLYQPGLERHLTVVAQAVPIPVAEYFDYCSRFLLALPALLFGLMIGFKQAEGRAYRCLSIMFVALSVVGYFYHFNYSPGGLGFAISKAVGIVSYSLVWYWIVAFTLFYQPYEQVGLRARLMRCLPWYRVLAFGTALYSVGFALGKETPMLWLGTLLSAAGGLALVSTSLVDGWRRSSGEIRQRHLWLLLSFACGSIPPILTLVPALSMEVSAGLRVTTVLYFVGQFLMYIGLAYSVLQYRVFNFDFAISRAVVFSVVSVVLLCAFGLIEWLYASAMHGDGGHGKNSLALDAAIALVVYLVLHKVHDKLERRVELLLFGKWHLNEHKLRAYVRQAAHVTTVDALLASFCEALDRFTSRAGCAVYQRRESGEYALAAGTLEGALAVIDNNDNAAVALRADFVPLLVDELHTALRGDLVLPMYHRGVLDGFVLIGGKRSGESYRPDELEALRFAAHHIGLDLHALRVDLLEREVSELERKAGRQREELLLMAGRRRSSRSVAGQEEPEAAAISA